MADKIERYEWVIENNVNHLEVKSFSYKAMFNIFLRADNLVLAMFVVSC